MAKYIVIKGTSFANVALCQVNTDYDTEYQLVNSHSSSDLTEGYYNNSNTETPKSNKISKCIKYALDNIDKIIIENGVPSGGFFYSAVDTMITSDADSYNTFVLKNNKYEAVVPANATHIAINFTNTDNTYTNLAIKDYREAD